VLAAGFRRLAIVFAAILAATVAVSALLGLAAGGDVRRAIAVGLYAVGAMILAGCFIIGARGPLRGQTRSGETTSLVGARRVRRATEDERSESVKTALLLFALGLALVVLGSLIDPAHTTF
jgi:hypothetical protein